MKKYKIELELDLVQVAALHSFSGSLNILCELYNESKKILEENKISCDDAKNLRDSFYITKDYVTYRSKLEKLIKDSLRKTIVIDGKKYSEEEVLSAINFASNIKDTFRQVK